MSMFNTPLPRAQQPVFHEGSDLRSNRDSDVTAQLWQKNRASQSQNDSYGIAIAAIQRELGKLRRRRQWISEGTAVDAKWCQIQAIKQDHFEVKEWDYTTDATVGDTFNVAKPTKLRGSITQEVIDGVTVDYDSYTATTYVGRTADDGTYTELQDITPRILANDIILAIKLTETGVQVSSVEVEWQDVNVDGRAWTRKFNQA